MGTNTIDSRSDATTITNAWYNEIRNALMGDVPARNSSAIITDISGSIGTGTYRWRRLYAQARQRLGSIKAHHSFNGACGPGHGWMLCDGRQITEANYDIEFSTGDWDTYIVSSPLENKYLPNLIDAYCLGASSISQDGTTAITGIGNNEINLEHLHKYYNRIANASSSDQSHNSSGSLTDLSVSSSVAHADYIYVAASGSLFVNDSYYTNKGLSTVFNIRPESIEVLFYMRIIP